MRGRKYKHSVAKYPNALLFTQTLQDDIQNDIYAYKADLDLDPTSEGSLVETKACIFQGYLGRAFCNMVISLW